jgi:hypothetical protein
VLRVGEVDFSEVFEVGGMKTFGFFCFSARDIPSFIMIPYLSFQVLQSAGVNNSKPSSGSKRSFMPRAQRSMPVGLQLTNIKTIDIGFLNYINLISHKTNTLVMQPIYLSLVSILSS